MGGLMVKLDIGQIVRGVRKVRDKVKGRKTCPNCEKLEARVAALEEEIKLLRYTF